MGSIRTFRGVDRRDVPAYPLREAAHYLRLPPTTLRQWVCGRMVGGRRDPGVIELPGKVGRSVVLSFNNLVECHILASLRREHDVSLRSIRSALRYVRRELGLQRPLLQQQFETNGADLFVEHLNLLVNASKGGQLGARALLSGALRRVERGVDGLPIKLYPFPGSQSSPDAPRHIVVDPAVSFGRPVIAGTGVPTQEVAARLRAGEEVSDLAEDFGVSEAQIVAAMRCELRDRDAAA
jgi:uncharacterized protein (DUF433 family)